MKKILFIIWSHSLGGGAEALLTMIVNHLNPQKYQIGIMEFYHSKVKKEVVNSNIRIHEPISFEGDREYQKKMYYVHREPDKMIRKFIPSGYDLYVSFNYQIPSFLLPAGCRNIAWIHGSVFDLAEEGMEEYRRLQDNAFGKAARIVSISDITTQSIRKLFPEHTDKLIEIYNAVDIGYLRKKADSFTEIRVKHPAVLWVGRMDDNKDPLRMLDIFDRVYGEIPSAHLYFLGEGGLKLQLQDKVIYYGLQDKVHLLGYIDNPFPIMKQVDLCCMTSRSEGFPVSLLESVAIGVPFVSTEIGGARLLSNGKRCGRIYKTNKEAVEAICGILKVPKEQMKKECEASIKRFDLDVYLSQIEELFDDVLKMKVTPESRTQWESIEGAEILEDRKYYYRFPEGVIPKDSNVILYGAGDIGTNYYSYIKETGICQIVAWIDAAAEKYREAGKDVRNVEALCEIEYDFILIAVMAEKVSKIIRMGLCERGVPENKILWTRPIF